MSAACSSVSRMFWLKFAYSWHQELDLSQAQTTIDQLYEKAREGGGVRRGL